MGRRRGERLEQAILNATWDLLTQVGYAKLTMEAVAARAGTSRPVIHRRWPTRARLALAALDHAAPPDAEPPDTGGLRTDLLAMMRQITHRFGSVHGEVLAGMTAETARDPEAAHALRARLTVTTRGQQVATMVRRAVERNEILPVLLPSRVTTLPLDLIRNEIVLYGRPPGEDAITEIVDSVLLPAILHAPAPGFDAGQPVAEKP
ncbi:TetR/AcrR family transcriptional regulator [Streptosporangium sp. NPDC020145]|uniref:TetR/AcrR family transcriptional regulator n=1 Tax=Streptosporangium sp. NPDC020145 TaxID=3154694 RepID=UPI003428774C